MATASAPDPWEVSFETAADGFASSTMNAMNKAFVLPVPEGLTQPQHCLAIMCGAVAAGAQQAAALANQCRTDPEEMLASLHGVLDTHFARKLTIETEGQG